MRYTFLIVIFFLTISLNVQQSNKWQLFGNYDHWDSLYIKKNNISSILGYSIIPETNSDYKILNNGLRLEDREDFNIKGFIINYRCYDCTQKAKTNEIKDLYFNFYYNGDKLIKVDWSSVCDYYYYYNYISKDKLLIIHKDSTGEREAISIIKLDSIGRVKTRKSFGFEIPYFCGDSVRQIYLEKDSVVYSFNKKVIVSNERFYKGIKQMTSDFIISRDDFNLLNNSSNFEVLDKLFNKISNDYLQYSDSTIITYYSNSIIKNVIIKNTKVIVNTTFYINDLGLITHKISDYGNYSFEKKYEYIFRK